LPDLWWTLFETNKEELENAGLQIVVLYERKKAEYHELTPLANKTN
jgi:hypothetical protein